MSIGGKFELSDYCQATLQLRNADFYRGEQSSEAGKLHVPDHRDDMEAVGEDEEDEDNTVQAGFDDFSG